MIHDFLKILFSSVYDYSESYAEHDHLFESLVALEEFCKELAAIAFVKYHHATE